MQKAPATIQVCKAESNRMGQTDPKTDGKEAPRPPPSTGAAAPNNPRKEGKGKPELPLGVSTPDRCRKPSGCRAARSELASGWVGSGCGN